MFALASVRTLPRLGLTNSTDSETAHSHCEHAYHDTTPATRTRDGGAAGGLGPRPPPSAAAAAAASSSTSLAAASAGVRCSATHSAISACPSHAHGTPNPRASRRATPRTPTTTPLRPRSAPGGGLPASARSARAAELLLPRSRRCTQASAAIQRRRLAERRRRRVAEEQPRERRRVAGAVEQWNRGAVE